MEFTKEEKLMHNLIARAWEDDTFKKELIKSPVRTIEKLTGKKYQATNDKKVFVVDQSNPDHVYINIPAKPNLNDVELTEDQLEAVAGGSDPMTWLRENLPDPVTDWLVDVFY